MTRRLTTLPRYVLLFETTDEFREQMKGSLTTINIPGDSLKKIREHIEGLPFGADPDLSQFNLPDGMTLRVEKLDPAHPKVILAVSGEEPHEPFDPLHYVPDGLHLDPDGKPPWQIEVGEYDHNRRVIGAGYGYANPLNRDQGKWRWADVSEEQDGSSWAHFTGHHVQVDINVTTYNYHERHDFKGKHNVRGRAKWTVALDRVQVGEGWSDTWENAHRAAGNYARRMQEQVGPMYGLTTSWRDAEKELLGRPVWYREQPAYVSMLLLDQGCIVVKPAMAEEFTRDPRFGDDFPQDENDSAKIELLSDSIYWYRDNSESDLFRFNPEDPYA